MIEQERRNSLSIMSRQRRRKAEEEDAGLPFLIVCSFCSKSEIPTRMRSRLPLKEAHSRQVSPFPREGFVSSRSGWCQLGCKIPKEPYLRREAEPLMKRTLAIVSAGRERGKLLYVKSFRGKRLNLYATHQKIPGPIF